VYDSSSGQVGSLVTLSSPGGSGLVATANGTLYVNSGSAVYRVVNGVATALNNARLGSVDGNFTTARFRSPSGMAMSLDETILYIAEPTTCKIRKIDLSGSQVTTLIGAAGCGDAVGLASGAKVSSPAGLYLLGTRLFIVDTGNKKIKMLDVNSLQVTDTTRCAVLNGPQSVFVKDGLMHVLDNTADVIVTLQGLDAIV
jgi:hypothetical protein